MLKVLSFSYTSFDTIEMDLNVIDSFSWSKIVKCWCFGIPSMQINSEYF